MAEVFNSPPTFTANQWEKKGRFYEVLGKEIFIIEKGDHEECLFILHGYLTSSYDYYKVLDALAEKYRVVIPDIFGFGLSEKNANHYTTIITQVDYLVELCKQMGLQQISILSHDFGIALGQELLTRDNAGLLNIDIKEFIYCNGILPIKNSYFLDIKDYVKKEVATKIITMLTTSGFFKKKY
ncbi:MAG: alpha/beta fold hydrolase [Flavobacteriaceae bacterium]|nr:alpha/beta fold hydrolase [Flavobacteriaceae bacterium]